jgi:hypothetical protein
LYNIKITNLYILPDTLKKILLKFTKKIKGILLGKEVLKKFLQLNKKYYNNLNIEEFIVIHEDPNRISDILIDVIQKIDEFKNSTISKKIKKYNNELIPYIISINIDNNTCYKIIPTTSCYSYNNINIKKDTYKVASIETIFTIYIYMLYMIDDKEHVNSLQCILIELYSAFLNNRTSQSGSYNRFSLNCKGYQETKMDIMSKKNNLYVKLQRQKKDPKMKKKLNELFFKYIPK